MNHLTCRSKCILVYCGHIEIKRVMITSLCFKKHFGFQVQLYVLFRSVYLPFAFVTVIHLSSVLHKRVIASSISGVFLFTEHVCSANYLR